MTTQGHGRGAGLPTAATFAASADAPFVSAEPPGPPLRLVDVTELATGAASAFSLLFETDPAEPPSQGLRTLRHPALGELTLFLVPVALGPDALVYEAVVAAPPHASQEVAS